MTYGNRNNGYTLTELLVVMSIIVLMTTAGILTFSGFTDTIALSRVSRELALNLRRTQNMALAVREVAGAAPNPQQFGIHLCLVTSCTDTAYAVFVDLNLNNQYDGASERIGDATTLPRGIHTASLQLNNGLTPASADIIFIAPEAFIRFYQGGVRLTSGGVEATQGDILIANAASTHFKHVVISIAGQIGVQ